MTNNVGDPARPATRREAREAWESMDKPSARKVADKLTADGYPVSFRTVIRWKEKNWEPPPQPMRKRLSVLVKSSLNAMPKGLESDVDTINAAGGLANALQGGGLTNEDLSRIEARRNALMNMTAADRTLAITKAREVMHILLMEEAARAANVMVLMPKDTGSLIEAFTDASRHSPGDSYGDLNTLQPGDDARIIEGKVEPPNPTASAIGDFLKSVA